MSLVELRSTIDKLKGQREFLSNRLENHIARQIEEEQQVKDYEQAVELFREVCQHTQSQIQGHLSEIVSTAMDAVFDNPYQLVVEFVQRRGKTECDLSFMRNDEKIDPLSGSGYGAVDVASFALRVSVWFLGGKSTRPTLILDEPFKHLKGMEENRRVLEMIGMLSRKFGLQIIMVSDERIPREDIIAHSDRMIEVHKLRGKSKVISDDGER